MRDLRLRSHHEVAGAVFREEAGWRVPASYGALTAEVAAVRSGAGVLDLGDRSKIEVRGEDRVSFLDGLVTADVKKAAPQTSAYGLVLTDKGRVVGDLRLHMFADRIVMDIEAAQRDAVTTYLRRFLVSDDVAFADLDPCDHLEIHGPSAPYLLSRALGRELRGVSLGATVPLEADTRRRAHATRLRTYGEPGFAIWGPGARLDTLWTALVRRGAVPVGRDAAEALRIESGVPRVGAELGEETLALEAAPPGAISFTKGCYVGQEVVARGTYRGHVRRRLVGLQVDGDVPPRGGDLVLLGAREVGRTTSATWSPTLGRVLALALLRVDEVPPAAPLSVSRGGWDLRARLHPLPFVRGSA